MLAIAGPLALAYLGLGLCFALYFATLGAARLDPTAHKAPLGFRILIVPGAAALWPFLLTKLLRGAPASSGTSTAQAGKQA